MTLRHALHIARQAPPAALPAPRSPDHPAAAAHYYRMQRRAGRLRRAAMWTGLAAPVFLTAGFLAYPAVETDDMLWQDWVFALGALALVVAVVLGLLALAVRLIASDDLPAPARLADRRPGDGGSPEARQFIPAAPVPVIAFFGVVALGFVVAGVDSALYLAEPSVTATVAGCQQVQDGETTRTYCNLLLPDGTLSSQVEVPEPKLEGAPVDVRVRGDTVESADQQRGYTLLAIPGLVVLGGLVWMLRWGQTGGARGKALRRLAERHGWDYWRQDDSWARCWPGWPFPRQSAGEVECHNVLVGRDGSGRALVAFDHLREVGSGEDARSERRTVCALAAGRPLMQRSLSSDDLWRKVTAPRYPLGGHRPHLTVEVRGADVLCIATTMLPPEQVEEVLQILSAVADELAIVDTAGEAEADAVLVTSHLRDQ
jgi:hypothetical protein